MVDIPYAVKQEMKMKLKFPHGIVFGILMITSATLEAGTVKRTGTAGAMHLLIPVGSAGTALSGNYTAGISGIEAMYWNPAGLATVSGPAEMIVSRMRYIADINLNYAAVHANFGKFGDLGASIKSLDFGSIPVTTEWATDGTGETYSPSYIVLSATYSRIMTDRIRFGVTTKLVSEKIINASASGLGFDFGVQYNTLMGLKLGAALRNIGTSMRFDGSDLERRVYLPNSIDKPIGQAEDLRITAQSFEMPTTMDIGIAYTRSLSPGHAVTVMGNYQSYQFGYDRYGMGLEYVFHHERLDFALRCGLTAAQDSDNGKWMFEDEQNIFGRSLGGGIQYRMASNLSLTVEYAYRINHLLSDNQWMTLIIGF
jgi:opacity protein-like surface antigen